VAVVEELAAGVVVCDGVNGLVSTIKKTEALFLVLGRVALNCQLS
jgi:hypothetical protein